MKTIDTIYSEYKIMPTLQQHQLRVAAVAKNICETINTSLDIQGVIKVCLLHDMGNIIKFDLNYFPEFVQPEGLVYWQKIKDDYVSKYGLDEHRATEQILHELKISENELRYFYAVGFKQVIHAVASGSLEQKICCYSDQRVGPYGVLSLKERILEGRKRYETRKDKTMTTESFEVFVHALETLEQQIFSHSSILPESISHDVIEKELSNLRNALI
jgi:hypothetical protein